MGDLIINTTDLLHNINEIKSKIKENDYTLIAVVKGNAYGLGIVEFTKFLMQNGFNFFAVASFEEAMILRENNIKEKIILLTPYKDKEELKALIENDIILTIDSENQFNLIEDIANKLNKKVCAHVKIDTGLSRYGFRYDDIINIANIVKRSKNIIFEGIFSHFSCSLKANSQFTNLQFSRFCNTIKELKKQGIEFKLKHICNSSGFFKYPNMHLNCARIGSAFIGNAVGIQSNLKKIGIMHTKITEIKTVNKNEYVGYANSYKAKKNMKIGILPIGYYDGIGMTLIEQRHKFLSKAKKLVLEFKNMFIDNSIMLGKFKVVGQVGMHDVAIDLTNRDYKENDDIYFYTRPNFINPELKRIYVVNKEGDKYEEN